LDFIYSTFPGGFEGEDDRVLVAKKEKTKLDLLKKEEETWRKKSRVTWLASGEKNTRFFMHMPTL
jgi:hypothetical protein